MHIWEIRPVYYNLNKRKTQVKDMKIKENVKGLLFQMLIIIIVKRVAHF